jgi:hypothetical protein
MPNGKPHLDGHLSVGGARRDIGDIKCCTLNCTQLSTDTIQLVSARDDGPDDDGEMVPADSYQDLCKLAEL